MSGRANEIIKTHFWQRLTAGSGPAYVQVCAERRQILVSFQNNKDYEQLPRLLKDQNKTAR